MRGMEVEQKELSSLLLRMRNGSAALESSLEVSYKTKRLVSYDTAGKFFGFCSKKKNKNKNKNKKTPKLGTSLAVQGLRLQVSNVQGVGISR